MNWISVERVKLLTSRTAVFALISWFSGISGASTVASNWWFVLPKNIASQKALQMKGSYKYVQESLSISAEIPTLFQGIDSDIAYEVKSFAPAAEGGAWGLSMLIPSISFKAASFSMDGIIEREVAGTKVRVKVKAICHGVQINTRRSFNIQINGDFRNQPFGVNVSNVVWSEDSDLWNITAQRCDGPAGFLAFVNQQVNVYWKSSDSFKQVFLTELNKNVMDWSVNKSAMSESFKDFATSLTVKPVEFVDRGTQWVFKLSSQINTEKKCIFAEVGEIKDATIPTVTQPTLVIPEGLVTKWSQCLHEMAHFKRLDDSSKTGFQTLMESSGSQAFVWPDLQRFPPTSKFDIATSSLGAWDLAPTTDVGTAIYRLKTSILSQFVHSSYRGKTPYVTFWGTFDGYLNLTKVGENLVLKIQGTPAAAFKYRFDMISKDITDKTIDTSRLKDEVITALKAEQMTFKIPTYEFSQAGIFQATTLTRSNGSLQFVIDFTKSK